MFGPSPHVRGQGVDDLGDHRRHVEADVLEDLVAGALREELVGGAEFDDADAGVGGPQVARMREPMPPRRTPSSMTATRLCSLANSMTLSGTGRTHLGSTIVADRPWAASASATSWARAANGPTETMRTSLA